MHEYSVSYECEYKCTQWEEGWKLKWLPIFHPDMNIIFKDE